MTLDGQRILIAEACGWKHDGKFPDPDICLWFRKEDAIHHRLPDYLNDLNAMHEAERTLDEVEAEKYEIELIQVCKGESFLWHATAAQRAEAFLKVKGLWK